MEYNKEDWSDMNDTPEEFEMAIKNAVSANEKIFFTKLRYKVLNEGAASYDVLMHNDDNEDGIYILRISDDFLIGRKNAEGKDVVVIIEIPGLFYFLSEDMFRQLNRHITILDWLRERDYAGIRYDANNDFR